jgi:hypothetical protein
MKRRITESDINRLVKKTINEIEDGYEDYTEDGWDVGETDFNAELLQDALYEARNFLEYELEYTDDECNQLSELDYVEILRENGQLELADQIEGLYFMIQEDPNKPYDAIGGHSPKDLENAFNKMMNKKRR